MRRRILHKSRYVVSRARLRRESVQIPIIILFLKRLEFLRVLIDLVANGAHGINSLFWHATWRAQQSPAFSDHVPIMFTPTSLGTLLLNMQYRKYINPLSTRFYLARSMESVKARSRSKHEIALHSI